ncbi:hypothetical protein N7501_008178 [Penicillium viridicatum]|nr:hypothetical protein N7501_008178 [Penicillium viridicatum]
MSSWLLAESAAVSVIVRMPLAHFADKSVSKRNWFLWALVLAFVSTIATAFGSSLFVLFVGRFVQAIAGSIMWVVGYTTVADTVPIQHTAKTYAAISMAVSLGTSTGPMISGILFQLAGYWVAWASAFTVIGVDIVFRLLMVEKNPTKQVGKYSQFSKHGSISDRATLKDVSEDTAERASNSEYSPLLSTQYDEPATTSPVLQKAPNFYRCIFSKPNFAGAVWCSFMFGFLTTTFNATVPLHVRDEFNWGSMQSGLIFAALQAPRLVMSPLVGWLKDRAGTRTPTAFGFVVLAPLIWLLGIPGNEHFPFANKGNRGPVLYVLTMTLIGVHITFLNGVGTIEATVAVDELQKKHPGAFGPNGGKSRALAIASIFWTLGSFVGPVAAGTLNDKVGYYTMNCVVGEYLRVFDILLANS